MQTLAFRTDDQVALLCKCARGAIRTHVSCTQAVLNSCIEVRRGRGHEPPNPSKPPKPASLTALRWKSSPTPLVPSNRIFGCLKIREKDVHLMSSHSSFEKSWGRREFGLARSDLSNQQVVICSVGRATKAQDNGASRQGRDGSIQCAVHTLVVLSAS